MNYPGSVQTTTTSGTSKILWKAIENSQSQVKNSGKHVILAAYQPRGMGLNYVRGAVPLYDLTDINLDGSVSLTERFFYDPYEVWKLIKEAGKASFIADAAIQLKDYELYNKAIADLLSTTHKACAKAATTLLVEKVLSPGFELNLALTALANLKVGSEIVQFIVQTSLETAIIESICATR